MTSDITYCVAQCKNVSCPRHSNRATKVVSWADFSKTCANYKRTANRAVKPLPLGMGSVKNSI